MLGLLAALPTLSIDISQPSLLAIQDELECSTQMVGLTITLFMCGFAAGQLGTGPMSDRYGRRPLLLLGLTCYTLAAVGCALATTAAILIGWRLVQGVGAGCCAVLAFTMIRDLFEGEVARAKRSYVTVVFGLAPMLAPTLGAWLLDTWGWRPVFVCLAIGGAVLLAIVALGVGESRARGASVMPARLGRAYAAVLAEPRFMRLATINALSYGAIFAFIAGSPLVLMGDLQFTPYGYGAFFACTAASLTAGAWVSGRSVKFGLGPRVLLSSALSLAAIAALALAALLALPVIPLVPAAAVLLTFLFCRGIIAPNAQHMALEPMREQAGTAAAAVGVMQITTGALASALVAFLLPHFGALGMTAVMAALAVSSLALWLLSRADTD